MNEIMKKYIASALVEDIYTGDITTDSLDLEGKSGTAEILFKQSGIVCGIDIVKEVYRQLDTTITITTFHNDGDHIEAGIVAAQVAGPLSSILKGERVALNFMQRMSGIATQAQLFCEQVENKVKIVDTRKTTPNFRIFEKYAVRVGGLYNHRMGLYDCVMIKDNHIAAAGSITKAVTSIRKNIPFTAKIEIETSNEQQFREALDAGADIIMLDNMSNAQIQYISSIPRGKTLVEVSGNMDIERIKELKEFNIDIISIGRLTYSYNAIDISMNIV